MHKPTRLERFAVVFPFLLAGAGLGAGGLFLEYKLHKTVLLQPLNYWLSEPIRGGMLFGPEGDYKLSFANTRFDWRVRRRGPAGAIPAMVVFSQPPDWRLEVYEVARGAAEVPIGPALVPTANGGLRLKPDGAVEGVVPVGARDLVLRFVPTPRTPDCYKDERALADMREIAGSVHQAELSGR